MTNPPLELLAFAERSRSRLVGRDARAALAELEGRHSDLLTTLGEFLEQGSTDEALRLVIALAPFWTSTNRMNEASTWYARTLAMDGGNDALRGRACFEAGLIAFWRGEDAAATTLHERAMAHGRAAADATVLALGLGGLARVVLRKRDIVAAEKLCREALEVVAGTDDRAGRSGALHVLGVAAQMAGDLDEARARMQERLDLMRAWDIVTGISSEAGNLSAVERQLGNLDRAEALAREALEIDVATGNELAIPWKLNALVGIAVARGDLPYGAVLAGAAERMIEDQGAAWPPDEKPMFEEGIMALELGLGPDSFEGLRSKGRAMGIQDAVRFALRGEG